MEQGTSHKVEHIRIVPLRCYNHTGWVTGSGIVRALCSLQINCFRSQRGERLDGYLDKHRF